MKYTGPFLTLCFASLLVGCSTTLKVDNMRVTDQQFVFPSKGRTATVATTKSFKGSDFKAEDFNTALVDSLRHSQLFSIVDKDGTYSIMADLVDWRWPGGFTQHSGVKVHYVVRKGNQTVYEKELESQSTATVGDALSGFKRARIAMERGVKLNIEMLIRELSQMPNL
jgi:hypothetical protein